MTHLEAVPRRRGRAEAGISRISWLQGESQYSVHTLLMHSLDFRCIYVPCRISVELTEVYEFPGGSAHLDCTTWPGRLPAPWVSSKEQAMTVAKIIQVALLSVEEVWST
ncbi:hypothetical protein LTR02_008939 [Friedmanniomyces endolithicus]|nr:hypothetical protein LTR94_008462 [Friedmanniomyces endolithicus]KAK0795592.1 hypothetical protein LTR59_007412 [Friedmanniomyces endolithicus]KAK0797667.1 hypothetical protein LTR38_008132 [Friedmanniomyces endolithicus]KAK0816342.1 hypothetical protein LTR75_003567 [Friedmanniomyces endolithicus]KAK0857978.1 hypothetical protein LTR03_000545 [Friedmanniomyces endolithicus]